MSVKVSNDFSTHTRKDSCRSNNCVSACLCCANANRHSVLSCRRSLIRPMIVPHSCAWQKPSRHFLPACAALQRRLASLNVRKSCACWLKTFWSAKIRLRFVIAFPFPRAHLKTKNRALQKAEITFCVRGVISPLLANLYMNRLLKGWRNTRRGEQFQARVVNYADDFVILSRGKAAEALEWTRNVVTRLGLTLNEAKTSIKQARKECFNFLGYAFGPHCYTKDGSWYTGASPSKKSVARIKQKVGDLLTPNNIGTWSEVRDRLNQMLKGWAAYFSYGTRRQVYQAIDYHVYDCVRHFSGGAIKCPRVALPGFHTGRFLANWVFSGFVEVALTPRS